MFDDAEDFDIEDEWEYPYRQCMAAGIRVIPLNPIVNGRCGCGNPDCEAPGKHPVFSNWQNTPVWDDQQIEMMRLYNHQLYPAYGVLVDKGLLVVDVDQRNGGVESFRRLCDDLGVEFDQVAGYSVQTGSGGASAHYYFRSEKVTGKLYQSRPDYPGIDFKSSGFVVGWGSPHISGFEYERIKGYPEDITEAPQALIDLLTHKGQFSGVNGGVVVEVSDNELKEVASFISVDALDYHGWVEVGMAFHHTTGGSEYGLELWDALSLDTDPDRYKDGVCARKWHTFGKSGSSVTMATLIFHARQGGYVDSVIIGNVDSFDEIAGAVNQENAEDYAENLSIVTRSAGINRRAMPGYAGEVYRWINSQCRFPREEITIGATMYALSCIGGMRHVDERDSMGLNVMIFNVAATGTGKEAVGQAVTRLMLAAAVIGAQHGKFKSEQEIKRNLFRNQSGFYSIDELGIELRKIDNAGKKGGAAYLEGIIGEVMSIYTKSIGILPVTGDEKETIKESIRAEIAGINKRIEKKGETPELAAKIDELTRGLVAADEGLKDPYLCVMGSTTPSTFDGCINHESANSGFISRAVIFREVETNPRWKPNFKKPELPFAMAMKMSSLYGGGETIEAGSRVQVRGNKHSITTSAEADQLLDESMNFFWLLGEKHKEKTGLEGITRRGNEIVLKFSLILAMADGGMRTTEHVLYAFALARADLELKIEYAYASINEDSIELAGDAKLVKLMSKLSLEVEMPRGQVNKMMRCSTKAEVDAMIVKLETGGKIVVTESMSANNALTKYVRRIS
jgi:hypothetical protein